MKQLFKSVVVSILTFEANLVLKRHKPKIIAMVGSVGKTSTKDAVYAAIKNHAYTRKAEKGYNSVDIGVQLTVLGLPNGWNSPLLWSKNIIEGFFIALFSRKYPEVLVLETGIDRPGDMGKLAEWIKPDMVVLTSLPSVPAHVEYFSSPEAVIEEKMKLVHAMNPDGVLIYNNDDTLIQAQLPEVLQKSIGFGRYLETDFNAKEDRIVYADDHPTGVEYTVSHGKKNFKVFIKNTVGTQHVYSCTAAIAVAAELKMNLSEAVKSINSLETPNGRMKIVKGIKGTLIIDDSYNSSPIAAKNALQALKEVSYAKRKIVVLGDMLELGKYSSAEHKSIGSQVPEVADMLLTVGIRSRRIAEGALASGMDEKNIFQYDEAKRAGLELQNIIQPGDVILVKASQGVRAERIVEEVMNEPYEAGKLLARQDKKWKDIK